MVVGGVCEKTRQYTKMTILQWKSSRRSNPLIPIFNEVRATPQTFLETLLPQSDISTIIYFWRNWVSLHPLSLLNFTMNKLKENKEKSVFSFLIANYQPNPKFEQNDAN